jgi:hypothetical protein
MGRHLLMSGAQSSGAFIQGELGWTSMVARRQVATLRQWGHIALMPNGRLVRQVVAACRTHAAQTGHKIRETWTSACVKVLHDVGLEEYADMGRFQGEGAICWGQWRSLVDERVQALERTRWGQYLLRRDTLALYREIKQAPGPELYLVVMSSQGRRIAAQMRAGQFQCDAFLATWKNRPERHFGGICRCCELDQLETVEHIVDRCPAYEHERSLFWLEVHHLLGMMGWGQLCGMRRPMWHVILGLPIPDLDEVLTYAVLRCADRYLVAACNKRLGILSTK